MSSVVAVPTQTLPSYVWISYSMIGVFIIIVHVWLLRQELIKRKNQDLIFTSKFSKYTSILCIIAGLLTGCFTVLKYIPGFCFFSDEFRLITIGVQSVFVGFFQLTRLHYCFSKSKVYSNKGYNNILFVIMYAIGYFIMIFSIFYPWIVRRINKCGINSRVEYYRNGSYVVHNGSLAFVAFILINVLWDFTTLMLYVIKVASFRKLKTDQKHVYERIKSILNRIILLTLLYELTIVIVLFTIAILIITKWNNPIGGIIYHLVWGLITINWSVSLFLMEQHNNKQYKQLLNILYYFKLYYICCCCKSMMIYELDLETTSLKRVISASNNTTITTSDVNNNKQTKPGNDVSVDETGGISIDIKMKEMSVVSIETKMS
eukprot:83056_1